MEGTLDIGFEIAEGENIYFLEFNACTSIYQCTIYFSA